MLPEIAALKAGGTVLKLGAAAGKGAEIIQKAGGAAQAAKDFAALGGTEVISGGVRIRTLSDGTRAVLYTATSTGEALIAIQEAGRTASKTAVNWTSLSPFPLRIDPNILKNGVFSTSTPILPLF